MVAAVKRRILIVDDEPGIGRVLGLRFKLAGYEVITTTSGSEAIELIHTHSPNLVLLDILMPGLTGLDVIERVRTFSTVPIVVMTARPESEREATEIGADYSLAKPFDVDALVRRIGLFLGGDPAER